MGNATQAQQDCFQNTQASKKKTTVQKASEIKPKNELNGHLFRNRWHAQMYSIFPSGYSHL